MEKGFCSVSIEKLIKAKWNYKEDNDAIMQKLIENIKRNGQIENIIIREIDNGLFEIVNGNHRLDALSVLNIDMVHCYNLGKISETQAKRIAIETNETRFMSNDIFLENIIKELLNDIDMEDLKLTIPIDIEKMIFSEEEKEEFFSENDDLKEMEYSVLIELNDEESAKEISNELTERGFKCKVLVS